MPVTDRALTRARTESESYSNGGWKGKSKLWLDDVRKPPDDSWVWARTLTAAKWYASRQTFKMMSLDHDLGGGHIPVKELGDDPDYLQIVGEETGLDFVDWLCFNDRVPDRVRIHTMNGSAATRMFSTFMGKIARLSNNPMVVIQPFDPMVDRR